MRKCLIIDIEVLWLFCPMVEMERDKYKRLLGYVYLSDGKMLNDEIIKAGYANDMTIPPNVKYQDRFLRAYEQARERKRGLWQ